MTSVRLRLRMRFAAAFLAFVTTAGLTGCLNVGGGRYAGMQKSNASSHGGMPIGPAPGGTLPNGIVPTGGVPGGVPQGAALDGAPPNGAVVNSSPIGCGTPGCTSCGRHGRSRESVVNLPSGGPFGPCPDESHRVSLPPYKVAPPDILFIDLVRMVPRPPYRVEPLETLFIEASDTLPGQPIKGPYVISPEGMVNLGYSYGSVHVAGMTIDQIQLVIRKHVAGIFRNPDTKLTQISVSLAQFRGFQNIRGEHLVRPDGTVSLGVYGSVYVAGLSLGQAKCVIEKHLSEYFLNPQISVDVFAYNSRVVYVIFDGGHLGQQIFRIPSTGNETVLDVIGQVQGLAPVSSKNRIWVARPSPTEMGCNQIRPVDWRAITEAGSTGTNYQLFPGDRVYVAANPWISFDNYLSIVMAPFERILGFSLLAQTVRNGGNTGNQ